MRMIYNVIDQMIAEIPLEEHPEYSEMIRTLHNVHQAWLYKAPEQMPDAFAYVSGVLEEHLGDPAGVAWKERIRDIFADKVKP